MLDQFANFAVGTLSAGIAAGVTTLPLTTGHGARFTQTRAYDAALWNSTDYGTAADDPSREMVRVTAGFGTDSLTILRAQQGTSDVAHNTGGKTYKLVATVSAKALNTDLNTVPMQGFALPGAKAVPLFYKGAVAGDHDLYTCPAGKRAWVNGPFTFYNAGASGVFVTVGVVVAGTMWRMGGSVFANGNSGDKMPMAGFILEAGHIIRANYDSALQTAICGTVLEFDNTAKVKSVVKYGIAAGNNLVYTCPAGHTMASFNQYGALWSPGMQVQSIDVNVTYHLKYVPSGDAVSAQHQVSANDFISPRNSATHLQMPAMAAGDAIYLGADLANGTAMAWLNVCELPNP